MFGLGPLELIIILVVVLLIFGPSKLPEIGRSIGRGIQELRSAAKEIDDPSEETERDEDSGK